MELPQIGATMASSASSSSSSFFTEPVRKWRINQNGVGYKPQLVVVIVVA
jgi:hypothetical protein